MDFSEISWVSEMDFVESCLTETTTPPPTESSPILMSSIPSTNSITSLISTEEYFTQFLTMDDTSVVEQPQTTKPQNSPTNDSTVTFSTATTTQPIILNFKNGNMGSVDSGNNKNGVKSNRPLDPEEEAIVTEVLRSQDMLFSDPKDKSKCVVEVRKVKPSRTRAASQHYDHAIGERNRREHLRQKFLTLAAMVPGLKKSDKISVLGDAIKYMQHLQERVTALEALEKKHTAANNNKESSAGDAKKSPPATTMPLESKDNSKDKEDEQAGPANSSNPEKVPLIEATLSSNNKILLKIQCEKRKGVLVNLLGVLETLNVTVVNSNATTFGDSNLDVTVVAEMEKGCDVMVNEVVKSLRGALQN